MEQISLFPLLDTQFLQPQPTPNNQHVVDTVQGFRYILDYLSDFQHEWLLNHIDQQEWDTFYQRRVQHYGHSYNFNGEQEGQEKEVDPFPEWVNRLCLKLHNDGHMPKIANQVLVSEYEPGQGIGDHTDKEACFMDTIVILSLGSSCVMDLTNVEDKTKKVPIWLAPRSLTVLSGDAKNRWMHGIPSRKSDMWDGRKYERQRRVSLSFRRLV
ncbi:alpha-ketoglutarate-dependent dioxygenase AlkB [Candidatus Poribacteria bacterium]|nr:alpha-ketoglutarate-dependent dioxygenase AlkB [Candidatus Poribacteria bacterium]